MTDEHSHTEHFEQLCAGYVLHTLDEAERQEFEQMLKDASEEERTVYQSMLSVTSQLAFTVKGNEPDPAIKEQLMTHVRSDAEPMEQKEPSAAEEIQKKAEEPKDEFDWFSFAIAASFALLIITLSLLFYSFSLNSEINELESKIEQNETDITELENELREKEKMLSVLEAQEVDIVRLSGMEANPDGYGKIIWSEQNQHVLLQASNLPAESQDREYQLWVLTAENPVSAGVFAVNEETDIFFQTDLAVDVLESANGFAVTMEPVGGSQQPTGDMYLMGNIE